MCAIDEVVLGQSSQYSQFLSSEGASAAYLQSYGVFGVRSQVSQAGSSPRLCFCWIFNFGYYSGQVVLVLVTTLYY